MNQPLKKMDAAVGPDQMVAAVVDTQSGGILAIIARASSDPTVSVEKMERLYALYKEEKADNARREFNVAMAAAQAEMPVIIKTEQNTSTNSRYAKLERICEAIAPVIEKHKFSLKFSEGKSDKPDKIRINCMVSCGGHSEEYHLDLSPDDKGMRGNDNKTKIHGEGSTFSYGRRYLTIMIFNLTIAGEDNDGNQGSRPRVQAEPTAKKPATPEDERKALLNELWVIVKPEAERLKNWNPQTWDGHNQVLWRLEVLDGAVPEHAQKLNIEKLKTTILKAKALIQQ